MKGGIVVFHDIVPHNSEVVGTSKFWKEVKDGYSYNEFVKDWKQGWAGIGVIFYQ